jgi:hypothetical protein
MCGLTAFALGCRSSFQSPAQFTDGVPCLQQRHQPAIVADDRPSAPVAIMPRNRQKTDQEQSHDQSTSRWLILAYDDLYSIQHIKQNLRPYWRRNGWEAADLLQASAKE